MGALEVRRLTNLARLMAAVMAGGGLPPSALKVGRCCRKRRLCGRPWLGACAGRVAWAGGVAEMHRHTTTRPLATPDDCRRTCSSPPGAQAFDFAAAPSPREVLFWRIFFEHLLGTCKTPADSADLFKR